MSASNEWSEYHLTPRGWEAGSEKLDFGGVTSAPTPEDRVITIREHEYISSSFGPMEMWSAVVWTSADSARVSDLQSQYGALRDADRYPLK